MFADMFKLANETSPAAATVEVPLVLHDEADDFRGLCWAIYASYGSSFPFIGQEIHSFTQTIGPSISGRCRYG